MLEVLRMADGSLCLAQVSGSGRTIIDISAADAHAFGAWVAENVPPTDAPITFYEMRLR